MNDKNEIMMIDAVERYILGEMNPDERLYFENLRKTNAEIDQLVVEHTLFLQQLNQFGERKNFKTVLHDVHTDLDEHGKIRSDKLRGKAKVVYLWKRYRRVTAIAASIAGIVAISISGLVWSNSPKPDNDEIERLSRTLKVQEIKQNMLQQDLNNIKETVKNDGKNKTDEIKFKTA